MRLDKFVCKSTDLNREEAIAKIHGGHVIVNGETATQASMQAHENNHITLDGQTLTPRPFRYILMHKPANTICSNIDEAYPSLFNALDVERPSEMHVAGRLDADTTGLVLITDDGRWSFDIIRPTQACKKTYRVSLSRTLAEDAAARFAEGVQLQGEDQLTLPAELEVINPKEVRLTITEGRYHQVKRMFAAIGNRVQSLHRESIGAVRLDVEVGQWRYLTEAEVESLR